MNYKELLKKQLIEQTNDKYICLKCKKIYSKLGICNHYFYNHTKKGIEKKEYLKEIALMNNNKPEMKKKISINTKEKLNTKEVRENLMKVMKSKEYKEKHKKIQTELWKDSKYRNNQSKLIKTSRTKEYKSKISKIIKESFNKPNSVFQSKEFSKKCSDNSIKLWKNEDFKKHQKISRLKSWNNPVRKKEASNRMKEIWKNSNHIEKVLRGKLKYSIKNNFHFGKVGTTKNGVIYESTFEKEVFEFLENNNIYFKSHENIPKSYKISDLVIDNIWIELDGMSRHKLKDNSEFGWNGKLEIYKNLKTKSIIKDYKIFTSTKDFVNWYKDTF